MAKLILDAEKLIQLDQGGPLAAGISPRDQVSLASVTLAELLNGVLSSDPLYRAARDQFAFDVYQTLEVIPYTKETAKEHAILLEFARQVGKPRNAHDLIIAAHARETGRLLVADNARARFGDLPGVRLR